MSWDPALLRKYTTTSHLKLLSQVRSELKDQPIQRPLVTTRTRKDSTASRRGGSRAPETRAQPSPVNAAVTPAVSHNITRRRSTAPVSSLAAAPAVEEHHQPIVAVPVLMDPVLHGHG